MDQFEELDNLFQEHFGSFEPAGNVVSDFNTSDDENELDEDMVSGIISGRVSEYTERDSCSENGHSEHNLDTDFEELEDFSCSCSNYCFEHFNKTDINDHIFKLREMTKDEKEMYIMGCLNEKWDRKLTSRQKERERQRYDYKFHGQSVCKSSFLIMFDISEKVLKNIAKHVHEHGVVPREHGNKGKKPANALKYEDISSAVKFICSFADEVGMPQPEAPRGSDGIPPIFLPSSDTKKAIHEKYLKSCEESDIRALKISSFEDVWLKCVPHIKIGKPKDDVCHRCECLRKKIVDSVQEDEKLLAIENFRQHILDAKTEHGYYRLCVDNAMKEMECWEGETLTNVHYTFDFAQHFQLPHHSHQMGPTYFAKLRKIQLFGVRIDSISRQLNYVIDEDQTIGPDGTQTNGPNAVISMLDHALTENSFGERQCTLHADNCSGQNKNQFVIAYLCWRVMTGRHDEINYCMQIPGHTRCLVDSGFAHIRKLFRRSDVDSLGQFMTLINKSAASNETVAFSAWTWRNWKEFLSANYKSVKGIRKFHHFRFTAVEPWAVFVKERVDSEEKRIMIKKSSGSTFDAMELPESISPAGLTADRQQYLYRNVRPFVRPAYQDDLCPAPEEE